MPTFEYRGKSVDYWDRPESSFSSLFLPGYHDTDLLPQETLIRRLNILAPPGHNSWWTDRPNAEFDSEITAERFLVDLITKAEIPFPHRPRSAFGGEAAIRLGFRYPSILPAVASWNGNFDFHELYGQGLELDTLFDRREQARQHTAILQVRQNDFPPSIWFGCPADSRWFRGNDRLHEKLNAVGVSHEFVVADECPYDAVTEFLVNGMAKRSRRLL